MVSSENDQILSVENSIMLVLSLKDASTLRMLKEPLLFLYYVIRLLGHEAVLWPQRITVK